MGQLVLASSSPRRRDLLRQIGLDFSVLAPDIDESVTPGETPQGYVQRMAVAKARAGFTLCQQDDNAGTPVVVAADTVVVVDDEILGKPCGLTQGTDMLMRLSGRSHQVMTAVAVYDGEQLESCLATAVVVFREISRGEAEAYWRTGEGADKAGSYGIQGIGGIFAERIEGSYSAVVGLPLAQTETLIRKLNIDTWSMRIDG